MCFLNPFQAGIQKAKKPLVTNLNERLYSQLHVGQLHKIHEVFHSNGPKVNSWNFSLKSLKSGSREPQTFFTWNEWLRIIIKKKKIVFNVTLSQSEAFSRQLS